MSLFPIFMELQDQPCLVVGGGVVAARKASALVDSGARVTVVAPEIGPEIARLAAEGLIAHRAGHFDRSDLDRIALAITATDDAAVNAEVSRLARRQRIPVNVVDDPALCSFITPAVIDRAPVMVAVSSGGAAPVLARLIRARIEAMLPSGIGRLASLAGRLRDTVKLRLPDPAARRLYWERVFDGPATDRLLSATDEEADTAMRDEIDRLVDSDSLGAAPMGSVALVGAGPGDPDLLTIRALRLLQSADVIVHDRLVSDAVMALSRRDAERLYVGKASGRHSVTQDDINDLLVRLARGGKRVVRLKGGDPFLFGRGGEEIQSLAAAGVPFQVVPGITSASGCAAYAGIPLTHRDHAQSCVFVTGHGKGDGEPDWPMLARSGQTLVIYMGLGTLAHTAERLVAHGLSASTPAAIVENGTLPTQRVVTATLETLAFKAENARVQSPALVIVGSVVSLRGQTAAQLECPVVPFMLPAPAAAA